MSTQPTAVSRQEALHGSLYALGAYGLWGLFPAYWKLLQAFPAMEILAHRVSFSFVFYLLLLRWKGGLGGVIALWRSGRERGALMLAALLIGCNWLMYISAVTSGFVMEASLGYFIAPLFNVAIGAVVLREKLSRLRWLAVLLAGVGVLLLTVQAERVPWVALGLAGSFSLYGLLRKRVQADTLTASTLETGMLVPAALGLLLVQRTDDSAVPLTALAAVLFVLSGVVTGLPLLWFAQAARRLPLSTLGFFQYISPTLQFLLAIFVYQEPFSPEKARSFGFIWLALVLYMVDARRRRA